MSRHVSLACRIDTGWVGTLKTSAINDIQSVFNITKRASFVIVIKMAISSQKFPSVNFVYCCFSIANKFIFA